MRSSWTSCYFFNSPGWFQHRLNIVAWANCKSCVLAKIFDIVSHPCSVFPWFKADVGLSGYGTFWAELALCVSMLSISSHQAISRVFSLRISSDQINWKGLIRLQQGTTGLCVSLQHQSVIMGEKHYATNKAARVNMDSGDVNILTFPHPTIRLFWLSKGSHGCHQNRHSEE